jgi:hypothetical protein
MTEASDELSPKKITGCLSAAVDLFMVRPLWFVLTHGMLTAVDAPAWLWVLFVVYVPATMVAAILAHVTGQLIENRTVKSA